MKGFKIYFVEGYCPREKLRNEALNSFCLWDFGRYYDGARRRAKLPSRKRVVQRVSSRLSFYSCIYSHILISISLNVYIALYYVGLINSKIGSSRTIRL